MNLHLLEVLPFWNQHFTLEYEECYDKTTELVVKGILRVELREEDAVE